MDDEILLESDNENILDNMNLVEDDIVRVDGVIVLKVDMKINDKEEMFDFFFFIKDMHWT